MTSNRAKKRRQPAGRHWPLLAALAGAGLLLAGALLARSRATQVPIQIQGAPRLQADPASVDLGNVPLGRTVAVRFELANIGDQPLSFAQAPFVEVVEGC